MPVHPKSGDLVGDWTPSPGNEKIANAWEWPCPSCGHGRETHCEPYQPIVYKDRNGVVHGEQHSRCSATIPILEKEIGPDGKPTGNTVATGTRFCGTCRRVF